MAPRGVCMAVAVLLAVHIATLPATSNVRNDGATSVEAIVGSGGVEEITTEEVRLLVGEGRRALQHVDGYGNIHQRLFASCAAAADDAKEYLKSQQPQNGDQYLTIVRNGIHYSIASYSKTLPHNEFGEVPTSELMKLQNALLSGAQHDFDRISLARGSQRKLTNPQSALSTTMGSPDAFLLLCPPAPRFQSQESSYEMLYLYAVSLLRDVPFFYFERGMSTVEHIIQDILADLNENPHLHEGTHGAFVTRANLFRWGPKSLQIGPMASQFLLHDVIIGNTHMSQEIVTEPDKPISVNLNGWLDIQKGIVTSTPLGPGPKYRACNYRVIASYVHNDPPCSAFVNAANILLQYNAPLSSTFGKKRNEQGFVTFGISDVLGAINEVCHIAFKTAWRHKWWTNLRLRPEVFAGRIHHTLASSQKYGIHPIVLNSKTIHHVKEHNSKMGSDTYLLSQVFTEASPTHPAYPAGHATVSGAAGTVLKAFFDNLVPLASLRDAGGYPFPIMESKTCQETYDQMKAERILDPRVLDQMTVASEIDKLAYNIGNARGAAGVHYPSDTTRGIELGEKVAIKYLKARSSMYHEKFEGFQFLTVSGNPIKVPFKAGSYPLPV